VRLSHFLVTVAAVTLTLAGAAPPVGAKSYTKDPVVVADGLNNPRGLAFGPDASLYIAEAGQGGTRCRKDQCIGLTGSVARLKDGQLTRLATGLVSIADKRGDFAVGADDVAVDANGRLYTVVTSAGRRTPSFVPADARRQVGRVLRIYQSSKITPLARVDRFEYDHNPDHGQVESNPYGLAASPGHQFVTDAAGNTLLDIRGRRTRLLAVFPDAARRADSVPTVVRIGPDGALYVGELSGERAPNGRSRVWRVIAGGKPKVFATGFSRITGLAFGRDGSMFVSEFSTNFRKQSPNGRVIRVSRGGTRTVIGAGKLFFPAGVAVEPDGAVYVSNWSTLPGRPATSGPFKGKNGQVVRFDP
jgi:sugar lactone lactonase YvrE